jgi:FO synthase
MERTLPMVAPYYTMRAAAIAAIVASMSELTRLMADASALRDRGHGRLISYSRKVFIPLTHLCRDVCHYCTFAETPEPGRAAYLSPDQVLAIARAGAAAGCTEALFTLGDKPELRYRAAREALQVLGHDSTISYLKAMCGLVLRETGLLPHANPGVMAREEIASLREVSASQGIMLESASPRLCEKGQVHFGSPDKHPAVRLETIRLAGELKVPFTTGILIGIGETRDERIESLNAIRDLHAQYGHIQEVIVQNFRTKPTIRAADLREPDAADVARTVAIARLILDPEVSVQAPPNLSPADHALLLAAGLNDWGGISPLTPDYVNPEAPWPHVAALAATCRAAGYRLAERLAIYPRYIEEPGWLAPALRPRVTALAA